MTFVLDAYFYMLKKWPYGQLGECETQSSRAPKTYSVSQIDRFFGQNTTDFSADRFMENQAKVLRIARMPYLWLAPHSQDELSGPNETEIENGYV